LLFNLQYFRTYDALIHTFFGAHYAQSWFDPWEPRWYTGFSLVSYPPLSHFLIAIASKVVGLKLAFAPVQLFALLQLAVGVYRFSRLFVSPKAAGFAALALVLSSAIAETVHVFGQLPTTLSLGFLLNAIPWVWAYIRTGRWGYLLKAAVWIGSTTAAHHVTTLFGSVFFIGPVVAMLILEGLRQPRPNEPAADVPGPAPAIPNGRFWHGGHRGTGAGGAALLALESLRPHCTGAHSPRQPGQFFAAAQHGADVLAHPLG
jgi:hypothetical protein